MLPSGGTNRAPRGLAIAVALGLSAMTACGTTVPRSVADVVLPPDQEAAMSEKVDAELHRELDLVEDPALVGYVNEVGQRVAAASAAERGPVAVHFEVVDDPETVNAFAAPGGNIYVTTGLLAAVDSEAELAGILGHEVGHVANRDIARGLAARYGMQVLAGAALGNDPGVVAQIATELAGAGALASHTREQERAADLASLDYMVQTGYDPEGLLQVFRTLSQERRGDPGLLAFLQTHPSPADRLQRIEQRILAMPQPAAGGERGEARFSRFDQRLRAYYGARGMQLRD